MPFAAISTFSSRVASGLSYAIGCPLRLFPVIGGGQQPKGIRNLLRGKGRFGSRALRAPESRKEKGVSRFICTHLAQAGIVPVAVRICFATMLATSVFGQTVEFPPAFEAASLKLN